MFSFRRGEPPGSAVIVQYAMVSIGGYPYSDKQWDT